MKLQTKWRHPWEEQFKKSMSVMLSLMIILVSLTSVVSVGIRTTVYNKSPWKVDLESPDNAKPLLIAGAAIGVILATVNIFTGPIDDIAAWAALSYAVAN